MGISIVSVLPTGLSLGVEITFPLQPAVVNNMMNLAAYISGALQSIIYSTIVDVDPADFAKEEDEVIER